MTGARKLTRDRDLCVSCAAILDSEEVPESRTCPECGGPVDP